MVATSLLLLAPRPRVVLRPTGDPVSSVFESDGTSKAVWADGRDTRLRVPADFEVYELSNRKGDLAGCFFQNFSGASSGTIYRPFFKPRKGKLALLDLPEKSYNPRVVGLDGFGRVLILDDLPVGAIWSGVAVEYTHAYLRERGAWIDAGIADDARFLKDGAVFGYFWADPKGRPLDASANRPNQRKVYFRWKAGRRTLYHA